jgi:ABC-type uncharacterized transport system substrate-binding protein
VQLELVGEEQKWHDIINSTPGKYDAVVVGLYHTLVNGRGENVDSGEILSWTSANTKVPLFAFWDFTVGSGKTAGGLVLFGKVQGQEAAKVAQRIFAGEKTESILPSIAMKGRFYFSESELKRWGLTLPERIKGQATLIE